jgi:hypothetical protein
MLKPFLGKQIDRYGDCATVTIFIIRWRSNGGYDRENLECYETLSKGATASARKSMKKFEHLLK